MGVANSKTQNSKKVAQVGLPKSVPKALVYEGLATLNRDFEQVLGDLERLEKLGTFPQRWQREFLKTWRATLEETRAWANFEVVEILHQREERDWVDFARIRQRSDKPLERPANVVPAKSSGQQSRRGR